MAPPYEQTLMRRLHTHNIKPYPAVVFKKKIVKWFFLQIPCDSWANNPIMVAVQSVSQWVSESVSQWISQSVSEWQGHLLSCFGQLKTHTFCGKEFVFWIMMLRITCEIEVSVRSTHSSRSRRSRRWQERTSAWWWWWWLHPPAQSYFYWWSSFHWTMYLMLHHKLIIQTHKNKCMQ